MSGGRVGWPRAHRGGAGNRRGRPGGAARRDVGGREAAARKVGAPALPIPRRCRCHARALARSPGHLEKEFKTIGNLGFGHEDKPAVLISGALGIGATTAEALGEIGVTGVGR